MEAITWLRHHVRWVGLGLIVLIGFGTALVGGLLGTPALASGAAGGSPGEAGTPSTGASECPSSNPPNQITLVAGTPQTAMLGSAFASVLQVALSNSDGCPVTSAAGIPVTFSAPASGASGVFSTSETNTTIVGADASGAVTAPPFTANTAAGGYTVTASSQYGSVSFSLTNTAAGIPARIVAIPLKRRTARVTSHYAEPLQVKVLDSNGNPLSGATVTFTLAPGGASRCGTSALSAGATFAGSATQATVTTGVSGVASSPLLTANSTAGSFTATAAVSGKEPTGGSGSGASGAITATPVSFSLSNLAGNPAKLTPGVGSTQSTAAGTAFPIPLAVTVTDAHNNPVPGALVAFSSPRAGASGRFTVHSEDPHHNRARVSRQHRRGVFRQHRTRVSHPRTVKVRTDTCGIAVAPTFTAENTLGGYIVKATVKHARPAAFALANVAPGQS